MKEIDNELRELQERGKLASASLVSDRLGVGKRQVRKLAVSGELGRVPYKGYKPASVFKYLEEKGRPVYW